MTYYAALESLCPALQTRRAFDGGTAIAFGVVARLNIHRGSSCCGCL